jgi:hypothetical protein
VDRYHTTRQGDWDTNRYTLHFDQPCRDLVASDEGLLTSDETAIHHGQDGLDSRADTGLFTLDEQTRTTLNENPGNGDAPFSPPPGDERDDGLDQTLDDEILDALAEAFIAATDQVWPPTRSGLRAWKRAFKEIRDEACASADDVYNYARAMLSVVTCDEYCTPKALATNWHVYGPSADRIAEWGY